MKYKIKRLIRYYSIFLFIFTCSSIFYAQDASKGNSKSCLWKVESKENRVYLLGSIHMLKKENYPLKKSIEDVFDDVQKLVFEIHLDSVESLSTQMMIFSKGMYQDDNTLRKTLGDTTYYSVKEKANDLGLNGEQMNKFKPWFLALTVMALKIQKLGFDPRYGIDKYFFEKAKQAEKKIAGLETVEYQINLFDALSMMNQEDLILQTFSEIDVLDEEIDKLVTAWTGGHLDELEEMVLKSFREYPEIYRQFIYQRNMNWLPKIELFLKQKKNVLVIVGAGHLLGDDGLLQLLQNRGYSIEQL